MYYLYMYYYVYYSNETRNYVSIITAVINELLYIG